MAESARRSRGGACLGVEALEGRMLLSRPTDGPTAPGLQVHFAREYVWPKLGEVDLTVTRLSVEAGGALRFKLRTGDLTESPMPGQTGRSRTIRKTGRDPSALPIVPIDGTYRFAPGQTSLTIPLRLNPNFVPKGEIRFLVKPVTPGVGYRDSAYLNIEPSPDLVPPEIVAWSLSPQAITLTFSKPMDPATVEDLNSYMVEGTSPADHNDVSPHPAALKSAVYDPATRTVTLTPTAPLTLASYQVVPRANDLSNPIDSRVYLPKPGVKPLADLQGNVLAYGPIDVRR